VEHQLAVVLLNEGSGQGCVAGAQGLDFVAGQGYPGLVSFENRVVMPGPPIRGDGPAACFPGRGDLLVNPVGPLNGLGHTPTWPILGERLGELLVPTTVMISVVPRPQVIARWLQFCR
jgi:hypothetical protein